MASKERDPDSKKDPGQPLTSNGIQEARDLGDQFVARGIIPAVYLTSCYLHAFRTGKVLSNRCSSADAPAPVIPLRLLTPHQLFSVQGIFLEAKENGHDLSSQDVVAFVLHHPRVNQLLSELTSQPGSKKELRFGTGVCLTADSLHNFLEGNSVEYCCIPDNCFST